PPPSTMYVATVHGLPAKPIKGTLPLRLGRESRGGDDLGVRPAQGLAAAGVVEVSVGEDEVTDRRMVRQAKIGHRGPHAVRADPRVDGDDSGACLDEREVAEVVAEGDVHVRRGTERARHRPPYPVPRGHRET